MFFLSDHQKSRACRSTASCTHWGEAGGSCRGGRRGGRDREVGEREGGRGQVEVTSRSGDEHTHPGAASAATQNPGRET